jgi:hypothetical protein
MESAHAHTSLPESTEAQFWAHIILMHVRGASRRARPQVFGRVSKGMGIVRRMENTPTRDGDAPIKPVVIADSGEIADGEDDGYYDAFADPNDPHPDFPSDVPEGEDLHKLADAIRVLGNEQVDPKPLHPEPETLNPTP